MQASHKQTSLLNEAWKKPEKKSQTNLIMIAIATIPVSFGLLDGSYLELLETILAWD